MILIQAHQQIYEKIDEKEENQSVAVSQSNFRTQRDEREGREESYT